MYIYTSIHACSHKDAFNHNNHASDCSDITHAQSGMFTCTPLTQLNLQKSPGSHLCILIPFL